MTKTKLVARTVTGKETKGENWRTIEPESGKTRKKRNATNKSSTKKLKEAGRKRVSKM
jgi:hypothetical protein